MSYENIWRCEQSRANPSLAGIPCSTGKNRDLSLSHLDAASKLQNNDAISMSDVEVSSLRNREDSQRSRYFSRQSREVWNVAGAGRNSAPTAVKELPLGRQEIRSKVAFQIFRQSAHPLEGESLEPCLRTTPPNELPFSPEDCLTGANEEAAVGLAPPHLQSKFTKKYGLANDLPSLDSPVFVVAVRIGRAIDRKRKPKPCFVPGSSQPRWPP